MIYLHNFVTMIVYLVNLFTLYLSDIPIK